VLCIYLKIRIFSNMSKLQTLYMCSNCDAQSLKWAGRCSECSAWGTLTAQTVDKKTEEKKKFQASPAALTDFNSISEADLPRFKVGIGEIDRVLGGGLVPGSLVLLGGEPGIGKSTLVAQIAGRLAAGSAGGGAGRQTVYVSGEESAAQIKARLTRLAIDLNRLKFLSETNAEKIVATLETAKPDLVIIDSIQTVYSSAIEGEAGGISQIRASAVKMLELAKQHNIAVILVGHITKDGGLAGPKSLEHIVDTVLYLEVETNHNFRILRASKNRFGSVNEIGVLDMTAAGFNEVTNTGAVFLETTGEPIAGSVVSAILEGSRPFLLEVQALASKTVFGYPQRKASGFDLNRLQVLIAVLTKRAKINLTNQDVILNLVGGLKTSDPVLDLAVCLAITSSLANQALDRRTIVLGEVGLGGEVRAVSRLEARLSEAEKLGFVKAIVPDSKISGNKIKLEKIKNIAEIVKLLR
jgi:DNA repair protein RadA/Sms